MFKSSVSPFIIPLQQEKKNYEKMTVLEVDSKSDSIQQLAKAHKNTGKELVVFLSLLVLIIIGFFAAVKFSS